MNPIERLPFAAAAFGLHLCVRTKAKPFYSAQSCRRLNCKVERVDYERIANCFCVCQSSYYSVQSCAMLLAFPLGFGLVHCGD